MISTSDFRKNSTKILWRDEPWMILDYQLVKPGKGGTYVRTKMKNLLTGRVLEETFRSAEKFPEPDLEKKTMQYLYTDSHAHFMDQESFDQVDFDLEAIETVKQLLQEGQEYTVLFFKGRPINVEPPMFLILEVKETLPGVKGDTAQGGNKPATLETGLVISVPLFVQEGQRIKIDTRDCSYIERVD
ncbi:MAG: Elongation factor P [candidate division TM6 bacterium GW2011_GWF2_28_16]|jgi:elongation factor P|nr:MAG: Elongation factor P [candidate division TM6 bacterium GW2011_GWF2_28_16]